MYMQERFGAWQVGEGENRGAVEFKVFFPDRAKDPGQYQPQRVGESGQPVSDFGDPKVTALQVAGSFQEALGQQAWDLQAAPRLTPDDTHPTGRVWRYVTPVELPAGFYEYKYLVTFENGEQRIVGDPCTRYGGTQNQNSAVVVGGSRPAVSPLAGTRRPLRDLVAYELMIDDFTDEFRGARAPLEAVTEKLPYLKDGLGIGAVLFMPWTAWPGEGFNWGYNPYQYFSVEYRYANAPGKPAEKLSHLKALISGCHEHGIQVFMDGVFNHVGDPDPNGVQADGFPYRWLYQDSEACPYVGKFGGTFGGLSDLDFNNGCTQEFIRDVCFYWMDTFDIDGIRFDNTVNFYIEGRQEGLPRLLADIRNHSAQNGKPEFPLILEHLEPDAAHVTNRTAATSYWNNEQYQRCFRYLYHGAIDQHVMTGLDSQRGLAPDKVATTYLSNHDHSHVAWQAGVPEGKGGLRWYRTQPYAIALLTAPGSPMLQNGQEFAEDYWLMEDDEGTSRRVKPRPLRWDFATDPIGSRLLTVYRQLIGIRNEHPALRSDNLYPANWETWQTRFNPEGYGVDVARQVVIFHRWGDDGTGNLERFIVAINYGPNDQSVDIPFPANGVWQDLLNNRADTVSGFRLTNQRIDSHWGRIYWQRAA